MKYIRFLAFLVLPLSMMSCGNNKEEKTYVSLSHTSITLSEDQTFKLEASIDDSLKDYLIFWNIRDENIASVSDGLITAKQVGNTICTVQVGKYTADCAVTVTSFAPVDALDISISNENISLNVDDTYELPISVTLGNQTITDYQLSADISDTSIISFNDKTITALSTGECTMLLTATYLTYSENKLINITVY